MATKNFNVNSVGYSAVVAVSPCRKVEIYEDDQAGTTDYYVSGAGNDNDRITRPAGSKTAFSLVHIEAGIILGYVKTVTGSVTFAQEENW